MKGKKMKLRIIWIIPNAAMYIAFIVLSVFVLIHMDGIREINQLEMWTAMLLLLLLTALFGTFRILAWIREGKM